MARDTELARLKAEIDAVEKKGEATRYPEPLRRRVVDFVAAEKTRGISIARTCRALGLPDQSVDYWRRTVPGTAIVPVGFQKVEIIETCRLSGIDPKRYLRRVVECEQDGLPAPLPRDLLDTPAS